MCLHTIILDPGNPQRIYVAISAARGISGNLPSDFGFPIAVHAHEPDTVYVIPITSDSEHYVPDGKLRVYRSRAGGEEWEPLVEGLTQAQLAEAAGLSQARIRNIQLNVA